MEDERRPRLFRELDTKGKVVRALAGGFLVLHLTAMFVGGSIDEVQAAFKPYIGFYASGLRMTNSWGMFGKPPTSTNVRIEAVKRDGSTVELSSTDAHGHSLWDRIHDARIRKFEGRIAEGERGLADPTLAYFCRYAQTHTPEGLVQVRAMSVLHELRDDDDKVTRTPSTELLALYPCRVTTP